MIDTCPECHQPVETYSRPCGYLRPVSTYNDGKQQEFADRKTFILNHGDHDVVTCRVHFNEREFLCKHCGAGAGKISPRLIALLEAMRQVYGRAIRIA